MQELLEYPRHPLHRPRVAACALCMDKVAAKHEMRATGIPTSRLGRVQRHAFASRARPTPWRDRGPPRLPRSVKPARQGSSLGVEFAADKQKVPAALVAACATTTAFCWSGTCAAAS